MRDTDIAWLAGLYEGEGSASIRATGTSVSVAIQMTDPDVIDRVQALFPAPTGIKSYPREGVRTQYCWALYRRDLIEQFLTAMLPFLGERRTAQARALLDHLAARPGSLGERTHCPRGHPYEGENLVVRYGRRWCRECSRQQNRDEYARKKEVVLARQAHYRKRKKAGLV